MEKQMSKPIGTVSRGTKASHNVFGAVADNKTCTVDIVSNPRNLSVGTQIACTTDLGEACSLYSTQDCQ
jgi:hypothetical protein